MAFLYYSSAFEHVILRPLAAGQDEQREHFDIHTSSTLPKANLLNTHALITLSVSLQLIHIQHQHIALHIHKYKARRVRVLLLRGPQRLVHPALRARRAARVHEELSLHLVRFELARAAPAQHVHVHLARRD